VVHVIADVAAEDVLAVRIRVRLELALLRL
jgi:hypothetical protein